MNPRKSSIIALSLVAVTAIIVFLNQSKDDSSQAMNAGTEAGPPQDSKGKRAVRSTESKEDQAARVAREQLAREEMKKEQASWLENASVSLAKSKKNLVADLELSAPEAAAVEQTFARREAELAGLIAQMKPSEGVDDLEVFRKVSALLRNKGLGEDLAGVLSAEKMARFQTNEADREREIFEARAYRDMADINAVVQLTDPQRQQVLAALVKNAPRKVEHEADALVFKTLLSGSYGTDSDPSQTRFLADLISAGMNKEISDDFDMYSPEFRQWKEAKRAEHMKSELSLLQEILDEKQLTRYREHLEAEWAW